MLQEFQPFRHAPLLRCSVLRIQTAGKRSLSG
jgi:hypothetical protein